MGDIENQNFVPSTGMASISENIVQSNENNNSATPQVNSNNGNANQEARTRRISRRSFGSLFRKISRDERKFSLAQLGKETTPQVANYQTSLGNKSRPSIGELQGEPKQEQNFAPADSTASTTEVSGGHIKLGWIAGVMIPCLLNIWGVMLFLRLSWVVGEAGILQSLLIVIVSLVVCVITTLSLSAICTNGEVKSGGVYYIISRSLGPEFGASVGVVFAFANAVAASMNTIGFCDSLNDLLGSNDLKIVDGGINDVRIVGVVTLAVLILVCCVGMEWESKVQNVLVAIIVLAIFNFLIGAAIGPMGNQQRIAEGFVGFSKQTITDNFVADYRPSEGKEQNVFSVFAIFFPSVTGIQAGANICGDLKDPAGSIPKGTFWALGISMSVYLIFVVFAGAAAVRDASGNVADLINGTIVSSKLPCVQDNTCSYGLLNSYSVMQLMSLWGPLIYAGCFAATLSTALTNLFSVPRLIQALGVDRIYPGLIFFSKPYGKHGEPYRGYVLTFIISAIFVLIGQLNLIAPLISNFYLASYALINFCTFHAALIKPLGWRPTFRFYNTWLSLFGFLLCIAVMFMINWISALITLVVIFALYLVVVYRKPDANWGSSTQAQQYKTAVTAVQRLQNVSDHVKNYSPQMLVLSGEPQARPYLIDFGHLITKQNSLLFVGNVFPLRLNYKQRLHLLKEGEEVLRMRKIKAFYSVIDGHSVEDGAATLIKTTGLGKMSPNIVLLGYKANWYQSSKHEVDSYFNILHNAFSLRMGVAVLRLPSGSDSTELQSDILTKGQRYNPGEAGFINPLMPSVNAAVDVLHMNSNMNISVLDDSINSSETSTLPMPNTANEIETDQIESTVKYCTKDGVQLSENVIDSLSAFRHKPGSGTIDVYWLYDDGGLTLLLPYIIQKRSNWQHCKLRVFALSHGKDDEAEEKSMSNLLAKFRIKYSQLIMLKGLTTHPRSYTINEHKQLISKAYENFGTNYNEMEWQMLEEKTFRQLRIHEEVVTYSSKAALVVMSLPIPRKEAISSPFYMSWLEMLSKDINCPVVLARGNQTPVLTFYS